MYHTDIFPPVSATYTCERLYMQWDLKATMSDSDSILPIIQAFNGFRQHFSTSFATLRFWDTYRLLTLRSRTSKIFPCIRLQYYHQVFTAATSCIVSVLLGLRASVFYSNQRRIVWLIIGALILSQVMSVGLTTLSEFAPWAPLPPQYVLLGGCKISLSQIQGYYVTGAWLSLLVYDALMFYMTIRKTLPMTRSVTLKHSLIQVLQREGITYFGVLFLLYIINVGTLLFSPPYYKGVLITFINALSCVLSGRVMLHIREAARRSMSASGCNIPLETIRFLPQRSLAGTQPETRDAI
ncbi:hypothetical protein BC629DRAFT_19963 [Irpex lacteus]|nr:hypothetical protein BC629DRAFT_19963 [Irpex lacteus]